MTLKFNNCIILSRIALDVILNQGPLYVTIDGAHPFRHDMSCLAISIELYKTRKLSILFL